jgi:hypothetical protein
MDHLAIAERVVGLVDGAAGALGDVAEGAARRIVGDAVGDAVGDVVDWAMGSTSGLARRAIGRRRSPPSRHEVEPREGEVEG